MTTMNNLKNMYAGMAIMAMALIGLITGWDWAEYGYFDSEVFGNACLYVIPTMLIVMVATYVGYHVVKGIKADVAEFKSSRKKVLYERRTEVKVER